MLDFNPVHNWVGLSYLLLTYQKKKFFFSLAFSLFITVFCTVPKLTMM
jgi:hypothetical protein